MKKMVSFVTVVAGWSVPLVLVSMFLGCGESAFPTYSGQQQSSPDRTPTGNIECNVEAVQSYFDGTCASGFAEMLTCWQAAGQCSATVDLSGYDVEFASGAVLEHTYTEGGQLDARYVSPSGEECGTFATESDNAAPFGYRITYNTQGGEQYEMRPSDSGNQEIVCQNGDTVSLTGAEEKLLQDCSGGDAVAICTTPDFDSPGDGTIDDLVDAVGKPCTSDSECPSGGGVNLVCCNLFGDKVCFESFACSVF